jgi:hypothetical protein
MRRIKQEIDRRLFRGVNRRIAKKRLGDATKLNYGINLKPGDLISTCKGYNEIITEITPRWSTWKMAKGEVIVDFDIQTETGGCSLEHCCTVPLETREAIYRKWLDQKHELFRSYAERIRKVVEAGGHAFDENGQPYYDFCLHDWERRKRFPKRWREEVRSNFDEVVGRFFGKDKNFQPAASRLVEALLLTEDELKDCLDPELAKRVQWGK